MALKTIDAHMHITQWISLDNVPLFDCIKQYQELNNIIAVDNMTCSTSNNPLWKGYELDQTILGAICKLENPNVFLHGSLYIPTDPSLVKKHDFKEQLDQMIALGVDGVKICDFKPDAYKLFSVEKLLDEYEEYISCCEEKGVHMCWHVADPETNWNPNLVSDRVRELGWFYGDGTFPKFDELIDMTYGFLDRHPNLNVTLAHAFFKSFNPDEMEALLNKYPNVTIDFALGWEMLKGFYAHYDKWYRIFREYSDRFMFATDGTINTSVNYVSGIAKLLLDFLTTDKIIEEPKRNIITKGMNLEKEHLDNMLYKNHQRVVGKTPKPINKEVLKQFIDKFLPLMEETNNKQMLKKYYNEKLI